MKRNLDRRVETIAPVVDPGLQRELDEILRVFDADNHSAWDLQSDGSYVRRRPVGGERARPAQGLFAEGVS
jgi:polyphosphate kinase